MQGTAGLRCVGVQSKIPPGSNQVKHKINHGLVSFSWSSMSKGLHLITRSMDRLIEEQMTLPSSELQQKKLLCPSFYCKRDPGLIMSFEISLDLCFACSSLWYYLTVQQWYGLYHIILTILVSCCLDSWSHSPFLPTDVWAVFPKLFMNSQILYFYQQKLLRVLNGSSESWHILRSAGQVFY